MKGEPVKYALNDPYRRRAGGGPKAGFALAASSCLLFAAAHEARAENPQEPPNLAQIEGPAGILETSGGAYQFTPTVCAIYTEDGIDDIEIQGLGATPEGEKFFFELSSTGNAMTIELGVDGPFQSSDRRIQAGQYVSEAFEVEVSGRNVAVSPLALADENGAPIEAGARLRINCGP